MTDPKIFIDHIDNDGLNNTKQNLRLSDAKRNAQNKSKSKTTKTSSKYIGISYNKKEKKWIGVISYDNKTIYHMSDKIEEYAARRRDIYILENLKDSHFKLNFMWKDADIVEWKNILNSTIAYPLRKRTSNSKPSSAFIGISYFSPHNEWRGTIMVARKTVYSKYDANEINAARRRDIFILENLKDSKKIKLNFIWTPTELEEWKAKLNII